MDDEMLTYEEFEEQFKPKQNHLDDNASFDGCAYETFGEEEAYIKQLNKEGKTNYIWTIVTGDAGTFFYCKGMCWVNRYGYIVTENPWSKNTPDVDINDKEPTETIIVDGKEYPARRLVVEKYATNDEEEDEPRELLIATQSLEDVLDVENNPDHERIDEMIYFYVQDFEIYVRENDLVCCLDFDDTEFNMDDVEDITNSQNVIQ